MGRVNKGLLLVFFKVSLKRIFSHFSEGGGDFRVDGRFEDDADDDEEGADEGQVRCLKKNISRKCRNSNIQIDSR